MTFLERISTIEARLNGGMNAVVAALGADMCADIANRVINTGIGADGTKFTAYSTKKVPAFWYLGRSRNTGGESKVRAAAKKKEGVSYREFRGFNNLPEDPKNFSFTNEMWRGFGVKKAEFNGGAYVLIVGGKTPESAKKMDWMEGQEGRSITDPNQAEIDRVTRLLTEKILQ